MPATDAGIDSGAYEVLDGGMYKFTNERRRTCLVACEELGLGCGSASYQGHSQQAVWNYGECERRSGCSLDYWEAGVCYSDVLPYPLQWFACACVPFRDAGP